MMNKYEIMLANQGGTLLSFRPFSEKMCSIGWWWCHIISV